MAAVLLVDGDQDRGERFGGGGEAAAIPASSRPASDLAGDGLSLTAALVEAGLCRSKGEARRLVRQGGVRVNGVAPGAILWPEHEISDLDKARILSRVPLARHGEVEDIARTVRFLVTEADYITGQIIPVDGGRTAQQ